MNEYDLREIWELEKPVYQAWGDFVAEEIKNSLKEKGKDLTSFLKVPAVCRIKDTDSLVDKAFYRPEKKYTDPYNDIEDKAGVRFVVLLVNEIKELCSIIEGSQHWDAKSCKHFNKDRKSQPLLFTYQSVHYVLRPKEKMRYKGQDIGKGTPCEVQIRTLLQHAHAELTHDAIYKSKRSVKPKVHRTVAKSMALIETADDFFVQVTKQLNKGPLEKTGLKKSLDVLYLEKIGAAPRNHKSSIIIWDAFEDLIKKDLYEDILAFTEKNEHLYTCIKRRLAESPIYQQSAVFFVYWLVKYRKNRLLDDWPMGNSILSDLALDLGISLRFG